MQPRDKRDFPQVGWSNEADLQPFPSGGVTNKGKIGRRLGLSF
jgi:hypothetical protein